MTQAAPEPPNRVLITGGHGFLGWHLRVRMRALSNAVPIVAARGSMTDPMLLRSAVAEADTVVHLAGVNRAGTDDEVETGNLSLAQSLADAVIAGGRPVHIVYANTIHAAGDTPYGRGKRQAAEVLAEAASGSGSTFVDVWLPNLFGEHGSPHYNSFVATFCHEVASGRTPVVSEDRALPLMHVQDAAECLRDAIDRRATYRIAPEVRTRSVSEVRDKLIGFHDMYVQGQTPDLSQKFSVDLFNTYRSHVFPDLFPLQVKVNEDQRGELFECARSHGGTGQTFMSSTAPGMTRGDHFHLTKVERFFVIRGEALISMRRTLHDEIVHFRVRGGDHTLVDMPTMWVHNIKNVGDSELVTLFWADQLFNPDAPDTYWELVDPRLVGEQP